MPCHSSVYAARFSAFYGCFYGLARPVLAWRAMEFCGLFAGPGIYSIQKNGMCCMPSKLRSMAFYGLACVYICLCRFGAFYACFCGVWRAIESGTLSDFGAVPVLPRIAAGAVDGNNYVIRV